MKYLKKMNESSRLDKDKIKQKILDNEVKIGTIDYDDNYDNPNDPGTKLSRNEELIENYEKQIRNFNDMITILKEENHLIYPKAKAKEFNL